MTNEQLLTIIISILTATIALGSLILAQARTMRRNITQMEMRLREYMRHLREDMRQDTAQIRGEVRDLRQHVDSQVGDLRDRMGRIEGYLDLLREFFLGSGRGTAA